MSLVSSKELIRLRQTEEHFPEGTDLPSLCRDVQFFEVKSIGHGLSLYLGPAIGRGGSGDLAGRDEQAINLLLAQFQFSR